MAKYAVINLKTDPKLKKLAAKTAEKLGISISAVLNNELRRFTAQQCVAFEVPETPNGQTGTALKKSKALIDAGDYHAFSSNEGSLDFLAKELK